MNTEMDTDLMYRWNRIHNWALDRSREVIPEPEPFKLEIVVIKKKTEITMDMIQHPEKYCLIYSLPRCSICGEMDHNARKHKNKK